MTRQYSFSNSDARPSADPSAAVLVLDTGSPMVSVAVAVAGEIAAEASATARHSSKRVLEMIDSCLQDAHLKPSALDLLVGVRGPGSFTGLRVGLATLQGMQLALGIPAATITTFDVLASFADRKTRRVIACVDAMHEEWMTQEYSAGEPVGNPQLPRRWNPGEIAPMRSVALVGYGISRLRDAFAPGNEVTLIEPGPLAGPVVCLLGSTDRFDWGADCLSRPLYLSPPAVSRPGPPRPNTDGD